MFGMEIKNEGLKYSRHVLYQMKDETLYLKVKKVSEFFGHTHRGLWFNENLTRSVFLVFEEAAIQTPMHLSMF